MTIPPVTVEDLDRIEAMAAGPAHVWSEEDAALVLQLVHEARERLFRGEVRALTGAGRFAQD